MKKLSGHVFFMKKAIAKALTGIKKGQTPFGACIVKDGKVVSLEHNTVFSGTDITAHAEITAIRSACRKLKTIDLSGCIIYSTCEPCPMCFAACHWAGIREIYYGAAIRDAKLAGFNELKVSNRQLKKYGQLKLKIHPSLLKKENEELFREWEKLDNRRLY